MKIQAITGLYARQKAYKNNQSYYTTPLKSDSLTFSSRQRIPVYIIDPEGERKRYDCLADLIQDKKTKFNTRTAFQINFSENSSGVAQNHIIIKADKVEYKDEFGNIKVDEEKFEEVKNLPFTKKRELVLINPDFSYQEFNSLRECAKQLKISDLEAYNLYNIPKNQIPSHIITDRHEVTNENDNKIDENKVKEIYEKKFRTKLEPIYAISQNGTCTKFASTRHFSEYCNIPYDAIGVTLNGINNTVRGYLLAKEEDVTSLDENGKKLIDTQKVKELYKKKLQNNTWKPLYD